MDRLGLFVCAGGGAMCAAAILSREATEERLRLEQMEFYSRAQSKFFDKFSMDRNAEAANIEFLRVVIRGLENKIDANKDILRGALLRVQAESDLARQSIQSAADNFKISSTTMGDHLGQFQNIAGKMDEQLVHFNEEHRALESAVQRVQSGSDKMDEGSVRLATKVRELFVKESALRHHIYHVLDALRGGRIPLKLLKPKPASKLQIADKGSDSAGE
jgi:hypothetical protein